jgi:sirohydrochlorin ferrochelatase
MPPTRTAVLLIAHGSRQEEANADLHFFVEQLRARATYDIVEACFLELATPNIDEGGQRCVAQNAMLVLLLPFFLSAGIHVRRDLTATCERLAERFPQVEFRLGEPLGRHPLLVEVVIERARQAAS